MADAVPVGAVPDVITAIDVAAMYIMPIERTVSYRFRLTWQSGHVEFTEFKTVQPADFDACLSSFCRPTPKNKFLTWLVSAGYENSITPQ